MRFSTDSQWDEEDGYAYEQEGDLEGVEEGTEQEVIEQGGAAEEVEQEFLEGEDSYDGSVH